MSSNWVGRIELTPMVVKTMTSQIHNSPKHDKCSDQNGSSRFINFDVTDARNHKIAKSYELSQCQQKNATRQTHKTETNQSKNNTKQTNRAQLLVLCNRTAAQPAPPARFPNSMARWLRITTTSSAPGATPRIAVMYKQGVASATRGLLG